MPNICVDKDFIMCISIENKANKFTKTSIKNDELRSYANEIAVVVANGRKARIQLCGIMAEMAAKDIFSETDGFGGFCETKLGIKKTQGYDMVRVGAVFGITRERGWKPALTAKGGEWTQTQLMALLPMGGTGKTKCTPEETLANCEALVERGWLKPEMTVAEIKQIVAEERPDRARLEAQKQKRLESKVAKEKMENEPEQATIPGVKIGTIGMYQLEDGSIQIAWDGVVTPFNQANIDKLVQLLQKATNFKS